MAMEARGRFCGGRQQVREPLCRVLGLQCESLLRRAGSGCHGGCWPATEVGV